MEMVNPSVAYGRLSPARLRSTHRHHDGGNITTDGDPLEIPASREDATGRLRATRCASDDRELLHAMSERPNAKSTGVGQASLRSERSETVPPREIEGDHVEDYTLAQAGKGSGRRASSREVKRSCSDSCGVGHFGDKATEAGIRRKQRRTRQKKEQGFCLWCRQMLGMDGRQRCHPDVRRVKQNSARKNHTRKTPGERRPMGRERASNRGRLSESYGRSVAGETECHPSVEQQGCVEDVCDSDEEGAAEALNRATPGAYFCSWECAARWNASFSPVQTRHERSLRIDVAAGRIVR